jgi:hypothetical protein
MRQSADKQMSSVWRGSFSAASAMGFLPESYFVTELWHGANQVVVGNVDNMERWQLRHRRWNLSFDVVS